MPRRLRRCTADNTHSVSRRIVTADEAATLLEQHQARPLYQRDGIFWTCKAGCDCAIPANSIRAATFEAQHQAAVLQAASAAERPHTELRVAS